MCKKNLDQPRLAVDFDGQGRGHPTAKFDSARVRNLILLSIGFSFPLNDLRFYKAVFFQVLQGFVNMALRGRPEMGY